MTEDPTSVRVSLQQILDLALGTPEVGSVNFNILHDLLYIVLNELNLTNNNVEYRGDDATRIKNALAGLKTGANHVPEAHTVPDGTSDDRETLDASGTPSVPSGDPTVATHGEQSVPSADPLAESSAIPSAERPRPPSLVPSTEPIGTPSAVPSTTSPSLSQEVAQLNGRFTEFEKNLSFLNDDVKELRETLGVERQPPTTPSAGPNEVESSDKTEPPIADGKTEQMAVIPELTVPSDETGKDDKVAGSQSELAPSRGTSSISKGVIAGVDLNELQADVSELKIEMAQAKKEIEIIQSHINPTSGSGPNKDSSTEKTPTGDVAPPVNGNVHFIEPGAIDTNNNIDVPINEGSAAPQVTPLPSPNDVKPNQLQSSSPVNPDGSSVVDTDKSSGDENKSQSQLSAVTESGGKPHELVDDKNEGGESSDATKTELTEAVQNMEIIYSEAVRNLEFRVAELEKEMKTLNATSSNTKTGAEGVHEVQALVTKIQEAYGDIEKINQTAARLVEEEEKRDSHNNVLMEQIELLKTIKADKEDLEDALADKADASAVNKKVSYDRFNNACDDLARGLEDATSKLTQQESIWQQSLDAVQQEIDNKLDRIEISPIREFINSRLQSLQEKIKELAAKKSENEAAGTRKVLTGLQCISCDKGAVMRIERGTNYQHTAVPPNRNIKPYLTYELDQLREEQRKFPGKNMNHLNAAMQEMGKKSKPLTRDAVMEKTSRDHLCNRYCGGSHTVITPQQRVMRMGHFLAQWGPEAAQLTPGVVRGTDGQLYHSRPMPLGARAANTRDVCGPSVNECCGMQDQNSSNQQMSQNRPSLTPETPSTSRRRSSQKEQRRSDSSPQTTPKSN